MFDDGFSAPLRAASGKDTAHATSVYTSSYEVNGVTEVPQTKRDVGMPSLVDAASSDMHVEYVVVESARCPFSLARHVPCVLRLAFARVGGRGDLCVPETVHRGPGHRRAARDCQPWASGAGVRRWSTVHRRTTRDRPGTPARAAVSGRRGSTPGRENIILYVMTNLHELCIALQHYCLNYA